MLAAEIFMAMKDKAEERLRNKFSSLTLDRSKISFESDKVCGLVDTSFNASATQKCQI